MAAYLADFEKISKAAAEDDRFCVRCLQVRTDVPVTMNLCYECGGGEEILQ